MAPLILTRTLHTGYYHYLHLIGKTTENAGYQLINGSDDVWTRAFWPKYCAPTIWHSTWPRVWGSSKCKLILGCPVSSDLWEETQGDFCVSWAGDTALRISSVWNLFANHPYDGWPGKVLFFCRINMATFTYKSYSSLHSRDSVSFIASPSISLLWGLYKPCNVL